MKKMLLVYLISLFLVGCSQLKDTPLQADPDLQILKDDGVTLGFKYTENNAWEYEVSTDLPTPCHVLKVDAIVRESFPEQVTVQVVVADENPGACAQVVTPRTTKGSFSASESASVELSVSRN